MTKKQFNLSNNIKKKIKRDKSITKIKLKNLVSKYKGVRYEAIHDKRNYNESQARNTLIDEFLEAFGWDVTDKNNTENVIAEDIISVNPTPKTKGNKQGTKREKTDYTLWNGHKRAIIVEAEKPYKDLDRDLQPSWQVRMYGWNFGTKIGLLTNIETTKIFYTLSKLDNPKEPEHKLKKGESIRDHHPEYVPQFEMSYKDYLKPANFKILWEYLSYDSVHYGIFDYVINKGTKGKYKKKSLNNYFLIDMQTWQLKICRDLLHNIDYINNIKNYYQCDDKKLLIHANNDTETFLNQIVFLQFAQDNTFESPHFIKNEMTNAKQFDNELHKLDHKYNSGIFHKNDIAKYLSSRLVKQFHYYLVYQAPYNFSVIPISILGLMYERFIQCQVATSPKNAKISKYDNKSQQWEPTNVKTKLTKTRQIRIKLGSGKRASNKSVVPTPPSIAKYIDKNSLGKKLKHIKHINDLFKLNVADLSTGSGTFLRIAYGMIEKKLKELAPQKWQYSQRLFRLEQKIISDDLYGVDIDKHATQVTKFSLALRLLKNKRKNSFTTPAIPSMDSNIVTFNSLLSNQDVIDFEKNFNKHHRSKFSIAEHQVDIVDHVKPRDPRVTKKWNNLKFDVIVGNPPYLKTQDMKKESKVGLSIYKNKFNTAAGQFDKYFLFIEQGLHLLKTNGILSYIVPNKFPKVGGDALRQYLEINHHLRDFIDFDKTQLFPGKSIYVAILVFTKHPNKELNYTQVNNINKISRTNYVHYSYGKGNVKKGIRPLDLMYYYANRPYGIWPLTTSAKLWNLFWNMRKCPKMTSVITPFNGIQTSKNSVYLTPSNKRESYHLNDDGTITLHKQIGTARQNIYKDFRIEQNLCEPFYKQGQLSMSQPKQNCLVIFPYRNNRLIPQNIMKNKYPNTWKYLDYYKHSLQKRNLNDVNKQTEWYAFGRQQALSLKLWQQPKLIVQVLSNRPVTGYDANGLVIASGGTAGYIALRSKSNSKYDLRYIEAWMNYPPVDKMFKMMSSIFHSGYWTHGTHIYQYIPFPSISLDYKKDKFLTHDKYRLKQNECEIYKDIIDYTSKLNSSNLGPTRSNTRNKQQTRDLYNQVINNDFTKLLKIKGLIK